MALCYCLIAGTRLVAYRSILRPAQPVQTVCIKYEDEDESTCKSIKDSHLNKAIVIDLFDREHFDRNLLPDGAIAYRTDKDKRVTGERLKFLIEHALKEIGQGKTKFTHFKPLKDREFSKKTGAGFFVLKFNDYPFVVKIFIETPANFTQPYATKGLEPLCLYVMSGGITRHLSGFTRLKNRERVIQKLSQDPVWSQFVEVPRKWYWLPKNDRWLALTGYNLGSTQPVHTKIPAIYGIIADAIEPVRGLSLLSRRDTCMSLDLCKYLHYKTDPNISNYVIESWPSEKPRPQLPKNPPTTSAIRPITYKRINTLLDQNQHLTIIDTEHFPTLVGVKDRFSAGNYVSWYVQLSAKFLKDKFLRSKQTRTRLLK